MLPLTSLPAHGLHPPWGSGCARREAPVNSQCLWEVGCVLPHPSPFPWEGIPEGLCLAALSGNTWGLIPGRAGGTRGDSSTGRSPS